MSRLKKIMPISNHPRHPQKSNGSPLKSSLVVDCLLFLGMINPSYKRISFSLEIQSVILNASRLLLNVGGKFVISCTVIGGPDDLNITWFKAGKEIGLSHRTKVGTRVRRSRLSVRDVMAEDEGAYICQAKYANRSFQNREWFITFPNPLNFITVLRDARAVILTTVRDKSPWDILTRSNENVLVTHLSNNICRFRTDFSSILPASPSNNVAN